MASQPNPPSFDDIIKDARQKKKNESLAAEIFGRSNTPSSGSLAGRHGISKRSQSPRLVHRTSSSSSVTRGQRNAPYRLNRPRNNGPANSQDEGGISIKGMGAGSCIVICQNFAPGTTAADIEAVMTPDQEQSVISCRLITSSPTVIAELVLTSRDEAQKLVERFNNKKADGRLLHVYIQNATPAPARFTQQQSLSARRGQQPAQSNQSYTDDGMEVDQRHGGVFSNDNREGQFQNEPRRAAPVIQDGSYGFGDDSNNTRSYNNRNGGGHFVRRGRGGQRGRQGGRLVSDSMLGDR